MRDQPTTEAARAALRCVIYTLIPSFYTSSAATAN